MAKAERKAKLGDEVKDKVSGFTGVITGMTEFLYGCTRVGVQPKVGKDGKLGDTQWFDQPQVEVVFAERVVVPEKTGDETGGVMNSIPTRNMAESR